MLTKEPKLLGYRAQTTLRFYFASQNKNGGKLKEKRKKSKSKSKNKSGKANQLVASKPDKRTLIEPSRKLSTIGKNLKISGQGRQISY